MAAVALAGLAATGPSASAQAGASWTLTSGTASASVAEDTGAGFAALPVTALEALGIELHAAAGGARLVVGAAEVLLRDGSPFIRVDGSLRQLVDEPYRHAGSLYVPVQFLVDQLPRLLGDQLAVDLAARSVSRTTSPAAAPAVAAAAPAAEPPPARPARPARPATVGAEPGAAPPPAPAPVARRAPPAPSSAARRLIVVDAGHGGVDPGASGPGGVREKDVTLSVAHRLAAILREDPTLEVRMTRERDTLIALTDRTRLANRWRAEGQDALFMSIHTNAHDRASVRGFETFFLSDALTEDARRVAEMENAAQRYENPGQQLDPLSFIFHDLRQNRYLRDSSTWAAMIQERLAGVHPGPNRGVKQAGFVVLNGAFMPAVLVELGFITHPAEERLLANAAYQDRLARELAASVREFFRVSAGTAAR